MKRRSYRIDGLKAIAIIAVVLYHFGGGYLPYGYLGVDIFLVISGYFMMKSIDHSMREDKFNYLNYLLGRAARLWPMILIVGAVALVVGYFSMLPDDFENLSQSVIASNVFANNILACITTKNYWDIVNVFKPLMHTWYVGVLMQAYIVLPLIYLVVYKCFKERMSAVKVSVIVISLLSLIAYLLPMAGSAEKFYYLPFRAFEITAGSLVALAPSREFKSKLAQHIVESICLIVMSILLIVNAAYIPMEVKLLLMVLATAMLVYIFANTDETPGRILKSFSYIGRASFSIYLCHQVVVAYMFYALTDRTDLFALLIFIIVVGCLSAALYMLLERPLEKVVRKNIWCVLIPCIALCLITSISSGMIYLHAGVVRDIPELGIDKENVHRGMHAEYVDIPYSWNKDFSESDKVKVVVIGDSFGRDWANILNESSISEDIEISYIYVQNSYEEYDDRFLEADVVFRAFSASTVDITNSLPEGVPDDKLYIVGYKNFGTSNGIIYSYRNSGDYFDQTVTLDDVVLRNNQILKEQYGDHYIDMIEPVQEEDGSIRVFTDDNYYISQDCRHLTKYGAQYYSRILDLSWITDIK